MKLKMSIAAAVSALALSANAANYTISNVVDGTSDTLYASNTNSLLSSGVVTLGVFTAGFDVAANLGNPAVLVSNFTTIFASAAIGGNSATLEGSFAGYAEGSLVDNPNILAGNPLLGQILYSFIGDGTTLQTSTAFALLSMGPLREDDPAENDYTSNPQARVGAPLIGTLGTISGNFGGQGPGDYVTLQLVPIPEPSVALLGLLGAVGFFRRRR